MQLDTQTDKRYMRPATAANYLDIGESTLWLWVKSKEGFPQPFRIGHRVTLFDAEAIAAWIEAQQAAQVT